MWIQLPRPPSQDQIWRVTLLEDGGFAKRGESVCQPLQIPQELIEDYALKQIKKKVLSSVNLDRIHQLIRKRVKKLRLLEKPDTSAIDQKLLAVKEKIEHIKDSIEAGINPGLVKDRLEKLDQERVILEAERVTLTSEETSDLDIDKVGGRYSVLSTTSMRL